MAKIIGNTTTTPNPKPDWLQTDETKADYIKNKPNLENGSGELSIQSKSSQLPKIANSDGSSKPGNDPDGLVMNADGTITQGDALTQEQIYNLMKADNLSPIGGATGQYATNFGWSNTAASRDSFTAGARLYAGKNAKETAIFGQGNYVNSSSSLVAGAGNYVPGGSYIFALGNGIYTDASTSHTVVLGYTANIKNTQSSLVGGRGNTVENLAGGILWGIDNNLKSNVTANNIVLGTSFNKKGANISFISGLSDTDWKITTKQRNKTVITYQGETLNGISWASGVIKTIGMKNINTTFVEEYDEWVPTDEIHTYNMSLNFSTNDSQYIQIPSPAVTIQVIKDVGAKTITFINESVGNQANLQMEFIELQVTIGNPNPCEFIGGSNAVIGYNNNIRETGAGNVFLLGSGLSAYNSQTIIGKNNLPNNNYDIIFANGNGAHKRNILMLPKDGTTLNAKLDSGLDVNGIVKATSFKGNLDGNATSADNANFARTALRDNRGNEIHFTYATKEELSELEGRVGSIDTVKNYDENEGTIKAKFDEIDSKLGDIGAALDAIIEIQNTLINGGNK